MVGHVKHVIWDLDNTLYPYTEAQLEHWHEAAVKAAVDLGVDIALEDGLALARQSYAQHNYSAQLFEENYQLCERQMHEAITGHTSETVLPICDMTPQAFEASPSLKHVILTHGHKDWADRVLRHLGLRDYFETQHILGLEDYDFKYKDVCNSGLTKALDLIGGGVSDSVFVEDNLKNLAKAKELNVSTAYIHHGTFCSQNDNKPDFVDYTYNKAHELLHDIHVSETAHKETAA
jgi:FMN phosphatase YigB (HAD superfamily)